MTTHYPPRFTRIMIATFLLTGIVMVTLDTTIAVIALPHIQSSISASQEQIVWVLTSYLIASAIATPLSGWLAERFGRKKIMLMAVAGFTLASIGCGISTSLEELVLFRLLQGMCGAGLVPLSQATMLDINPPTSHASAMTVFSIGTLVGPLIGPTLGGWLTESLSWRSVFLINVPFGIIGFIGLLIFMTEQKGQNVRFDLMGFAVLSIFLASFQLMIDRGQQLDWFNSTEICIEAAIAAIFAYITVVHMTTAKTPFIKPALFKDRNFLMGSLLATMIGMSIFAIVPLMTTMIETLFGYPVLLTGWVSAPRAIGNLIFMILVGMFAQRVDPKLLIITGMVLMMISLWSLIRLSLDATTTMFMLTGFIQGCGSGFLFVPLTMLVLSTLKPEYRNEGATMFALTRNLGSAVGISAIQALTIRDTSAHSTRLAENVRPDNPALIWAVPDFDPLSAGSISAIQQEIARQASMLAYIDSFRLLLAIVILMIPFALMMRTGKKPGKQEPMPHIE